MRKPIKRKSKPNAEWGNNLVKMVLRAIDDSSWDILSRDLIAHQTFDWLDNQVGKMLDYDMVKKQIRLFASEAMKESVVSGSGFKSGFDKSN